MDVSFEAVVDFMGQESCEDVVEGIEAVEFDIRGEIGEESCCVE